MSTITPDDVAISLGVDTPTGRKHDQWEQWIRTADRLIAHRASRLGLTVDDLNGEDVDFVVLEAVAARASQPTVGNTSTQVTVDDATVTRRYDKATGRIEVLDEWWDLLFGSFRSKRPRVGSIRIGVPSYRLPGQGCPSGLYDSRWDRG